MEEQELRRRERSTGDEQADLAAFQQRHLRLAERVERFLMRLVILGLTALALVQTLAIVPPVRRVLNLTEGMDGVAVSEESTWAALWRQPAVAVSNTGGSVNSQPAGQPVGTYTFSVVLMSAPSAPDVALLVAGRKVAAFTAGRVDVPVRVGQSLAIDATRHAGPLRFRVVQTGGLTSPEPGLEVQTHGNRASLGVAARSN